MRHSKRFIAASIRLMFVLAMLALAMGTGASAIPSADFVSKITANSDIVADTAATDQSQPCSNCPST
jgi:hypothetical protein